VRRVAVVTTASGCGGTTLGTRLAARLGVPFHELDALHWKPGWVEATAEELRASVEPIVATEAWVIDGSYQSKIGDLVLRNADVVVWLDLPLRVWLPRLVRRTVRRARTGESLWGTNRETIRAALLSRDSLLLYALRTYRGRMRRYPVRFAAYDTRRLRSPAEVERFLDGLPTGRTDA
jgi:adenylate kinase family enzyme